MSGGLPFTMSFSPESLSAIAQMAGFPVLLDPQMQVAMQQGGDLIVAQAQANTDARFANPSGELRDSIVPLLDSPYELQIQVQVAWGHRRNDGFVGKDSQGRVYDDPGVYYLTDAMTTTSQQVLQMFDTGLQNALAQIGGVS